VEISLTKKSGTNLNLIESEILYEDNHLIIINKQTGVLVQGDITGDLSLFEIVKDYLKKKYKKKGNVFLGLVNRIDRPTSGIVIFAKTSKALSRMNKKLRNREIKKIYWLIISNKFHSNYGEIKGWFKKNKKQNKSYLWDEEVKNSKYGSLLFKKLKNLDNYSLVEVELITGRHHQIRCSFSKIGYPVLGDLKYGSKRSNKDGGIYLHSKEVEFTHPVSEKKIVIKAKTPLTGLWSASLSY
jgi:23S rRNA pseudouridine1911/1915/1917 synthase